MLDLHTHVLPGVDDGPATTADALALLDALVADGVQHVVATPHIYPGVHDNTFEGIEQAFQALRREAAVRQLPLTMSWAAEVRLCAEMLEWHDEHRLPLYGGYAATQPAVLLELPDGTIPLRADRLIGKLVSLGLQPVIAHPERNRAVMVDVDRIDALRRQGAKLQLTAGSLLGEFGARAAAAAHELLRRGWVDAVASDTHNLRARQPRMRAARDWLTRHYGASVAEQLTEIGPSTLSGVGAIAHESPSGWALRDLPTASSVQSGRDLSINTQGADDVIGRRPANAGPFVLTDWHASMSIPDPSPEVSDSGCRKVEVVPLRHVDELSELSEGDVAGDELAEPELDLRGFALPPSTGMHKAPDLDDLSFAMPLHAGETFDAVRAGDVIELYGAVEPSLAPAPSTLSSGPGASAAPEESTATWDLSKPAPAGEAGVEAPIVTVVSPVPATAMAFDVMAELMRARALNFHQRGERPVAIGFVPSAMGADRPDDEADPQRPADARRP